MNPLSIVIIHNLTSSSVKFSSSSTSKVSTPYPEGVVAAVGTDSTGIVSDIGSVVHIEADTGSINDWVGNVQDGRELAPVQPELAPHSSLTRYSPSFPLRADMLCNPSHHGLLIYKIYSIN